MPRRHEVDTWLSSYDNPMRDVVMRIREIILAADTRVDECIKWQAPTFTFEGNMASFYHKEPAAREPDVPPGREDTGLPPASGGHRRYKPCPEVRESGGGRGGPGRHREDCTRLVHLARVRRRHGQASGPPQSRHLACRQVSPLGQPGYRSRDTRRCGSAKGLHGRPSGSRARHGRLAACDSRQNRAQRQL